MPRPETLSPSSVWALFNFSSLYLIGYAWLLGMSIWVTFFAGQIAFRALPRHQFGALQHRVFPVYFSQSIIGAAGLLVLWVRAHPDVSAHIFSPAVADVAQAYVLVSVLVMQAANYFVVGPLTSKVLFERHKLEKSEGKSYNEQGVSTDMKTLNRRFGMAHGISSLCNLLAVISLIFHGLWIANASTGL
ncbi:uncharacterized protein B0H18DRAFT_1081605 [Fomitopsis serialis]|uniref:uncharacterized protein n=1 Tax=Fomitopsis serialis TaxID=139415 RepID=UPI002008B676|nr:uncharacterized protein B0H18DRAFT_1081605 [Neoantrodia serialis]KAH9937411.1 hypothetical protein B0H18DRAFT_1081605 [Neoantrodia serialis]